jgi:hypothetical protein
MGSSFPGMLDAIEQDKGQCFAIVFVTLPNLDNSELSKKHSKLKVAL